MFTNWPHYIAPSNESMTLWGVWEVGRVPANALWKYGGHYDDSELPEVEEERAWYSLREGGMAVESRSVRCIMNACLQWELLPFLYRSQRSLEGKKACPSSLMLSRAQLPFECYDHNWNFAARDSQRQLVDIWRPVSWSGGKYDIGPYVSACGPYVIFKNEASHCYINILVVW